MLAPKEKFASAPSRTIVLRVGEPPCVSMAPRSAPIIAMSRMFPGGAFSVRRRTAPPCECCETTSGRLMIQENDGGVDGARTRDLRLDRPRRRSAQHGRFYRKL